jgi:Na+-translocating ferredoxin:NAD+ oxidoreductase RnfC subunit
MDTSPVILRIDATYHLTVKPGDRVEQGQRVCDSPASAKTPTAPISGRIEDIHFDPAPHEFIIKIHPA